MTRRSLFYLVWVRYTCAMRLFHVSETSGLLEFVPRPVVWAIDEEHLPHYLLPRDCPRVAFLAPTGERIVAVEEAWRDRIQKSSIFVYEMPPANFRCVDVGAGYYTSSVTVVPLRCHEQTPSVEGLLILPELWTLRKSVTESELEFSVIRFRNAQASPTT